MRKTISSLYVLGLLMFPAGADSTNLGAISQTPTVIDDGSPGWVWCKATVLEDPEFSDGHAHAMGTGSYAAYSFQGCGIEVYTMTAQTVAADGKLHELGRLSMSIDGVHISTASQLSQYQQVGCRTLRASGLDPQKHHVLELRSEAGWAIVDYLKVLPSSSPGIDETSLSTKRTDDGGSEGHNFLENCGFEQGWDLDPWKTWSDKDNGRAAYSICSTTPYSGGWIAVEWANKPYVISLLQIVSGLPKGSYSLTAWVRSSGGQTLCQMGAKRYSASGDGCTVLIPAEDAWTHVTIPHISINTGQCECFFYSDAEAGQWLNVDEVSLTKE